MAALTPIRLRAGAAVLILLGVGQGRTCPKEDQGMTSVRNVYERIVSAAGVVGSAIRVAGALESRRTPDPRDLRRMGMDPKAFTSIGHG